MQRIITAVLVGAVVGAAPIAASAQAVRAMERDNPTKASTGDPNRRICKATTATGSRLAKAKICKSAREWAEQQYEHKKQLEQIQNRPNRPDEG